jgi:hypothetical protein
VRCDAIDGQIGSVVRLRTTSPSTRPSTDGFSLATTAPQIAALANAFLAALAVRYLLQWHLPSLPNCLTFPLNHLHSIPSVLSCSPSCLRIANVIKPCTVLRLTTRGKLHCNIAHQHLQSNNRYRLTVVGQSPAVLELLTSKDQTLLVWGDTLLVLDLGLDIVDRVGRLDLEGDGLARQAVGSVVFCIERVRVGLSLPVVSA